MEPNGIVAISAKPLTTENIYTNPAFSIQDEKRNSLGNASNHSRESDNTTKAETTEKSEPAENAYTEIPPPKRDSGSVEFSLSKRVPSKERLKSISDGPYRGMGKEELLRYSSRPLWRNLRYICISIVLTGWLALLITVVALVLIYPKCRNVPEREWWQTTVVYRIYVRSFQDSEAKADGNGDIKGIRQQLDYLSSLGVGTIALSPIFELAPDATSDTQVINHTNVDPMFGTLEEFKLLVNETHSRGMHITLDFIPNHTSQNHTWFQQSASSNFLHENPYRSYYIWSEGLGQNRVMAPNNWTSVYQCSAWKIREDNSFYLHQFEASEPELNLRSEKVKEELENILQFWLELGVDGFYIRDTDYLFEDYDLRDDILIHNSSITNCSPDKSLPTYESYNHKYTKGLPEIFDILARWRYFLDDYGNKTGHYKILFADVDGPYQHVMNYYGRFNRDGVDFPLNKFSLELNETSGGQGVGQMVSDWMKHMPKHRWANWMGGDDRSKRLADRLGEEMSGTYLMLSLLLPGTPYLYYGDEIGLQEVVLNSTSASSPRSQAKPMRGPMQWNNKTNAGFCPECLAKPWMEIHPGYKTDMNVEAKMNDPESEWHLLKNLTTLRKDNPAFEYGDFVVVLQDDEVFSFVREFDGERGYLVALNFVDKESKKRLTGRHSTVPGSASVNIAWGSKKRHRKGGSTNLDPVTLAPFEGIVVSWDYKAKDL
ncbi:neutral and basic amino acid transport protein rBAT-like [Physella acuta]|uniref:neutral and basic amino acid transport protein rBAT-like n=1 Tax=Physella acuta TaxID=109671 RepID=UPI0027DC7D0A|nr:neutral and basic amino acid transport protein rBAT-like [Physella acuta]